MLTRLLSQLLSLIAEGLGSVCGNVLSELDLDFSLLNSFIPGLTTFKNLLIGLGMIVIFFCIMAYGIQLVATPFTGDQQRASVGSIVKCFLFAVLTFFVYPFTIWIFSNTINQIYHLFLTSLDSIDATNTLFDSENMTAISENFSDNLVMSLGVTAGVTTIFSLVVLLIILFRVLQLTFNLMSRYITLGLCIYVSPLCVSFGVYPGTSNIPKTWARTLLSQVILMFFTAWGVKVFFYSMATATAADADALTYFLKLLFLLGFSKFVLKADEFLAKIGFQTTPTMADISGALGSAAGMGLMIARTAISSRSGASSGSGGSSGPVRAEGKGMVAGSIRGSVPQGDKTAYKESIVKASMKDGQHIPFEQQAFDNKPEAKEWNANVKADAKAERSRVYAESLKNGATRSEASRAASAAAETYKKSHEAIYDKNLTKDQVKQFNIAAAEYNRGLDIGKDIRNGGAQSLKAESLNNYLEVEDNSVTAISDASDMALAGYGKGNTESFLIYETGDDFASFDANITNRDGTITPGKYVIAHEDSEFANDIKAVDLRDYKVKPGYRDLGDGYRGYTLTEKEPSAVNQTIRSHTATADANAKNGNRRRYD